MRLMSKLIRKRIKLHIVFVDGGKDACFHNGTCSAVCVLYSVPIKLNFFVQFFSRHFRFCRTVCELELCAGSLKSLLVIHGDFNHHFVCLIFYWFYQMIYFNFLSPMDSRTINSHTNIHHITCGWKKNHFFMQNSLNVLFYSHRKHSSNDNVREKSSARKIRHVINRTKKCPISQHIWNAWRPTNARKCEFNSDFSVNTLGKRKSVWVLSCVYASEMLLKPKIRKPVWLV